MGVVLDQSLLALQDSQKYSIYILRYIAEQFLYIKEIYKVNNYFKSLKY